MNIQDYVDIFKKEYQYDDLFESEEYDAQKLCDEMGFNNINQLVGTLLEANRFKLDRILSYADVIRTRDYQILQLEKTIDELKEKYGSSNYEVNNIKNKHSKNTMEKKASP